MTPEGYTRVGRILRTFGVKGELKVEINIDFDSTPTDNEEGFTPVEAFFVARPEGMLPIFIEYMRAWSSATPILKLEEVNSKEEGKAWQGMDLYLPEEEVELTADLSFTRLIGFTIQDLRLGTLGVIEAIYDLPQQEVARIDYEGNEVLVPLHDDFLLEIDEAGQIVSVDLPEGLLDVYL